MVLRSKAPGLTHMTNVMLERWLIRRQCPFYQRSRIFSICFCRLNGLPEAALTGGSPSPPGALSFMPGQRLSRCTCEGEEHPGPKHSDSTYVGRSAPEIDVIEATVVGDPKHGEVSKKYTLQSLAQIMS